MIFSPVFKAVLQNKKPQIAPVHTDDLKSNLWLSVKFVVKSFYLK